MCIYIHPVCEEHWTNLSTHFCIRAVLFARFQKSTWLNVIYTISPSTCLFTPIMIVDSPKQAPSADETSYPVSLSRYDTQNLCSGYTLRRHRFESETNTACHEARLDWIKYVAPIEEFGGCNPINGNFTALVLPLTKPERLGLIAYAFECKIRTICGSFFFTLDATAPVQYSFANYK